MVRKQHYWQGIYNYTPNQIMLPREQPWKLPKLQRKGPTSDIDHCMTARCVVHDLCSTVLHAIQNWLRSNINFSSRQQNKIPNHNRNKNHHFSGHQTLPVLPLQNQNFRQILSQKVGLDFSAFSLDQDAMHFQLAFRIRAFLESNSEFFWSAFSYFLGQVHVSFKVILWMISSFTPHSSVFNDKIKHIREKIRPNQHHLSFHTCTVIGWKPQFFSKMFRDWRNFNDFFQR